MHLNITLTPFGVSISDKVRKHEAFMYSSAFILVFFPPCFHFLSPFLQVHRYIGAEVSSGAVMGVNYGEQQGREVHIPALPASLALYATRTAAAH